MAGKYYVYVYFRPNGTPCYVGKGQGKRWREHLKKSSNPILAKIIKKHGANLPVVKVRDDLSSDEALAVEVALIAAIGRKAHGGPLANLTDGGDGKPGYVMGAATREKIGKAKRGGKHSEETRAKMSVTRKGVAKSDAHKYAIGAAHKGRIPTDVARTNMKKSADARWARDGERGRIVDFHASMTELQRADRAAKISSATKAAMNNPDVRAKISAARKATIARKKNGNS